MKPKIGEPMSDHSQNIKIKLALTLPMATQILPVRTSTELTTNIKNTILCHIELI